MTEKKSKGSALDQITELLRETKTQTSKFKHSQKVDSPGSNCNSCGRCDVYSKINGKCIFHCEKNDWYLLNTKGEKVWDKAKVDEFWKELHDVSDESWKTSFNHYIFPKFVKNSFWNDGDGAKFDTGAVFLWCTFLDDANFYRAKFNDALMFGFCEIHGNADFRNAEFFENINFSDNVFKENIYFSQSTCGKSGVFAKSKIIKEAHFSGCIFEGDFSFTENTIGGRAEFSLIRSKKKIDFMSTKFKKDVTFWYTRFNQASFEGVIFSTGNQVLFQDAILGRSTFSNIIFTEDIVFRRSHLEYTTFPNSKIDQAQFSECYFNNFLKRKSTFDEILIRTPQQDNSEEESDTIAIKFLEKINPGKISSKDYEEVEELNRQLKKNFEEKRDYETAGDFHIGEMDMRRRKYLLEVKEKNTRVNIFTYKIFSIWNFFTVNPAKRFLLFWYWIFSEYGEKPGKVFSWFLLVPFFMFLYYASFSFSDLGTSFEFAFTSFIPLLPNNIDVSTLNWISRSIFYFEIIISAVLWFLLLLSIRRKFRR